MTGKKKAEIIGLSVLMNSFKYLLQHVLILSYGIYFRLLVIHERRLLADREYKTVGGAKIAFIKMFGENALAWNRAITPKWSRFYNPGKQCLNIWTGELKEW